MSFKNRDKNGRNRISIQYLISLTLQRFCFYSTIVVSHNNILQANLFYVNAIEFFTETTHNHAHPIHTHHFAIRRVPVADC